MEGGQKQNIPLTSELDIKTSDMMSPVSAPKFMHNRQQYQGHYLPSSLRFEHDGWAAGWDVWQFDINTQGVSTSPAGFTVIKNNLTDNSYILTFQKSTGLTQVEDYTRIWWDAITSSLTSGITASQSGNTSRFIGNLDGKQYTVTINPLTEEYTASDGFAVSVDIDSQGKYTVMVHDLSKSVSFFSVLYPAGDMFNNNNNNSVFAGISSIDGNVYTWKSDVNTATYNTATGVCTVNGDVCTSSVVSNVLSAVYVYKYKEDITINFTSQKVYPYLSDLTLAAQSDYGYVVNNSASVNAALVEKFTVKSDYKYLYSGNKVTLTGYLPLWCGIICKRDPVATPSEVARITLVDGDYDDVNLNIRLQKGPGISLYSGPVTEELSFDIYGHCKKYVLQTDPVNTRSFTASAGYSAKVSKVASSAWLADTSEYYPDTEYLDGDDTHDAGYYIHGNYASGLDVLHDFGQGFYIDGEYWAQTGIDSAGYPIWTSAKVSDSDVVDIDWSLTRDMSDAVFSYGSAWTVASGSGASTKYKRDFTSCLKIVLTDSDGAEIPETQIHNPEPFITVTGSLSVSLNNVTIAPIGAFSGTSYNAYKNYITGAITWGSTGGLHNFYDTITSKIDSDASRCVMAYCYKSYFELWLRLDDWLTTSNADDKVYLEVVPTGLTSLLKVHCDGSTSSLFWFEPVFEFRLQNVQLTSTNEFSCNIYIEGDADTEDEDTGDIIVSQDKLFYTESLSYTMPDYIYYNDIDRVNNSNDNGLTAFTPQGGTTGFNITGTGNSSTIISSGSVSWPGSDKMDHSFFTGVLPTWIDSAGISIADPVISVVKNGVLSMSWSATQGIQIKFSSAVIPGTFVCNEAVVALIDGSVTIDGYTADVSVKDLSNIAAVTCTVQVPVQYNLQAKLAGINIGSVKSLADDVYALDYNGNEYTVDTINLVTDFLGKEFTTEKTAVAYTTDIDYTMSTEFQAYVRGPYKALDNMRAVSFNNNTLTVEINGTQYSVNISATKGSKGLFDPDLSSNMTFKYIDTQEEELVSNITAEVEPGNEYQFLKQQWDTTNATENFWWVDDSHVLVLTKTRFILRTKTSELDDWDGDVFEDSRTWLRSVYLKPEVLRYGMTSAYNGASALFWVIKKTSSIVFTVTFYNPFTMSQQNTMTFTLTHKELGVQLITANTTQLNTYSTIVIDNLISQSKFSSTVLNNYILFGIHYDSNFNQWVGVKPLTNGTQKVIQGYGFVGVDGSLTGGEIPSVYFDVNKGFTGTVKPLSVLSATPKDISESNGILSLYNIDVGDIVVGNDAQQWYIRKSMPGIVSHLTYTSNGSFSAKILYLNNNLAQVYGSPSFLLRSMSDYVPWVMSAMEIFPSEAGDAGSNALGILYKTIIAIAGAPMIYGMSPKFNTTAYLQQTLGQYAYVHYNSTGGAEKDKTVESDTESVSNSQNNIVSADDKGNEELKSSDVTFNTHVIKQSGSYDSPWKSFVGACIMSYLAVDAFDKQELKVNAQQNQSAVSDVGKKFETFFLNNMDGLSSAANVIKGAVPTVSSTVTGNLSLDMFYSTSDRQQVQAGPGWVNHNFVAQCVAQSVTSNQLELNQVGVQYIISALSIYQLKLTVRGEEMTADILEKEALVVNTMSMSIMGNAINIGAVMGQAMIAGAKVIRVAMQAQQLFLELFPTILQGLGADEIHPNILNSTSNHVYDVEGKHKYGSKSECFMWPCFGVDTPQKINDEKVTAQLGNNAWPLKMPISMAYSHNISTLTEYSYNTYKFLSGLRTYKVENTAEWKNITCYNYDKVPYYTAKLQGTAVQVTLPADMSYVIGTDTFLPNTLYRNENIGESDPVFPTAPFQDYIIDKQWQIGQTASVGMTTWISCKDTKLIDGELSNAVISSTFCGLAAPYTAIEVKKGITRKYLRPWAITPNALLLNNTGLNCCFERKVYHAADGFGYRIVNWLGASGMNKEHQTFMYSFLVNDRFKRSNKMPLNEFLGNFKSDPVVATYGDYNDKVFTLITQPGEGKGLTSGTVGEDKDIRRYSVPIFSEFVSTLPAVVKTISAYNLSVVDGITTLTSDNRDLQTAYKAPVSVDFAIGKNMYRYTQEYICTLQQQSGVSIVQDVVPCLGLEYIGATPYEAYLYSPATRQYYQFTGGSSLQLVDMIERFRNVVNGRYDFVNQEVLMPCFATFVRLDRQVQDDENEVDNVIIPRLKGGRFIGEVQPPAETIFNTRSWFRTLSMPMGTVYQGPNRCVVNRFVLSDYMVKQIKDNYGLWRRVPREEYHPFRTYKAQYERVDQDIGTEVEVTGWTHNLFLLVTAPLGVGEETDCLFEWEVTFCWPVEMDKLYDQGKYATVNIWGECMTPGGKVIPERPVHVYLTKELFTRTGNYGYYSFRYQSKCGAGNRERLHIWSDQYICVSGLQVEYKTVTSKRTEILTQQVDIQDMSEI